MTASGTSLKNGTEANNAQASHTVLSEGLHNILQYLAISVLILLHAGADNPAKSCDRLVM